MNDQSDTNTPDNSSAQPSTPVNPAPDTSATPVSSTTPSSWEPATPSATTGSSESTKPPAPATSPNQPVKKSPLVKIVLMLLIVILIVAAAFIGYSMSKSKADKDSAQLKSQITALQSNEHLLPAGAIKVSDCIPNMGAHYLPKDSDPEYGPFILVNKAGKVIGLEYMAAPDMFTSIPQTNPPVQVITKNGSLFGWKFNHTEFSHLPKGHEGLTRDHIDVHMFTVPTDVVKNSCV